MSCPVSWRRSPRPHSASRSFHPDAAGCGWFHLANTRCAFLAQSVTAGIDVARRALDPRLPVNPGYVHHPLLLPRGPARNTFTTLTSLLPGTVPIGPDTQDRLVVHCLDVAQPVAAQLAAEEALLMRIIDENTGNG